MHSGGHNHGHGQAHGQGHTHHAGCSHAQQHEIQPDEYFKQLEKLKQKNIEFYWMQILKGAVLAKYLQKFGLAFINSINVQFLQGIIGMVHMMLTFDWIPIIVRPFISGMFWMISVYIFINYKIITGFSANDKDKTNQSNAQLFDRTVNTAIIYLPLIIYTLVAIRTSGKVNTPDNKKIGKRVLQIRPYLQSPNFMCSMCQIPKAFRSVHCPVCKACTPKFTRHSLIFGVCIGAANQLVAILFFLSMNIFSGYCLYKFTTLRQLYGIITQVMIYILNISIFWMSFTQLSSLFTLNIRFGLTEFEIQNWMMMQYLMKAPMRQFLNSCNNGIVHNLAESVYAFFNISGYQSVLNQFKTQNQQRQDQPLKEQMSSESKLLSFPQIKQGVKYIINWNKAYIYVIPQMPNNPRRKEIQTIMKVEQPRMIANFKLIKKFKKQVKDQNPGLNQFQIQQRAMMKMNEHLMKNPAALNVMKPPPEQQKIVQLQMLAHMKMQFKNDLQIYNGFEQIQTKLKSGTFGPDQASMAIRTIQQKVMQKKMKQMMQAQKAQLQSQAQGQGQIQGQPQIKAQNKQLGVAQSQVNLQSLMQAQMLQRLEQRTKQKQIKSEQKNEQKPRTEKQQQSQKLKDDEVGSENL